MNCMEWEERVALYAGGDPAEGVEQHLAECDECRTFCAGLRETLESLHAAHRDGIDAAHFTAVRAGVIAEIERSRRAWRRLAWVSGVGIAAMLLLGLALRPGPLPAPPRPVLAAIPPAELVRTPPAHQSAPAPRMKREPVLVKLQTSDPNVVIYWIAD
jgi:anti-sigma factor RsiW